MSGGDSRFHLLGVAAAACLACCAPLVVGLLAGVTVAGVAASAVVGVAGLVVAAGAALAWLVVRRRHAACEVAPAGPVPVAGPVRRA